LGYDPKKFVKKDVSALKKKFGVDNFAIGFMGRLSQEKGILTLIEACSKLGFQYHLILDKYVNTEFIKEMEKKAKELNVKGRIIYIDPAYEEVQDYINMFDVLVLPSQTAPWWKEQFGRVLVEAMACEVPVIGSSSGSIPFVIGDAGLVFEEGSAKELAENISELEENEVLRRKLISAGKERAKQFTWKRIAKDYYDVYKEMEKN